MKKTIKTKGKLMIGALIIMTCTTMFTGCSYYTPKLISGVSTSTKLAKTDTAKIAYDFVQKAKDNDYQGIQNEDERLKYLKIDAVASLVDNTINSEVIHDSAYELTKVDEENTTELAGAEKVEKFTYTKKSKDNKDTKEFKVYMTKDNKVVYKTDKTNIHTNVQVSMPYGTECSIEEVKLDDSLNKKSDITNGLMTYTIPYLAEEFRATCTTADWGTLDTVAKLVTDEKNKEYGKPLAVRFALNDTDASKILEATKTMCNEIVTNIGKETSDADFNKYVASNKPELATMINTGLKAMSYKGYVKSVVMSSIAQSDKATAPVYVFNDSGEVYVEAKIQNNWVFMGSTESEKVYCRYRIAKDSKNSNNSGYVFTWLAGTESGYPTLIGEVNSFWQDWK